MKPETEKADREYYNSYHRKYSKNNPKVKRYKYLRYHYRAELAKVESGENGTMLLSVLKKKLDELQTMKYNYTIERKLRSATKEDIQDDANKLFYFKEGLHITRITRMMPEDYSNWKWIKGTSKEKMFKDSAREDWNDKTDFLFTLLMEENLYIEKNEDIR